MNISWNKKYEVTNINEIYGNQHIVNNLKNMTNSNILKHMILYGPPGTGKSSSIHCIKNSFNNYDILHLNASTNRSANIINKNIQYYLQLKGNNKLIILEEFDNIMIGSQHAIVSLIDKFPSSIFIFTCNNIDKIIDSIKDRSLLLHFNKLKKKIIEKKLKEIIRYEHIEYTDKGLNELLKCSAGDMRKAINYLQVIFYGFNKLCLKSVLKLTDVSLYNKCYKMLKHCITKNNNKVFSILQLLIGAGYSTEDIIVNLYNNCFDNTEYRSKFFDNVSETYINVLNGSNKSLQLYGLISRLLI